ncbi:MAG: DNA adenine methylase [Candidatus Aenigmarchaeota archaeon]|nr:DNA adenine methylase [Candidatus Aenigmarchaeota archaeon]
MKYYSPLRYPGGKGKITSYMKEIIKKNSLVGGIYVEPYAGGAAVAISLLLDEYVDKIIINDIDYSIYAFWYSMINKTKELCQLIEKTPITITEWKKQKKIQSIKNCDLLTLGFSTLFLNRTNRSGILKNAGPIGGFEQKGKWKLNVRYSKSDIIERIKRISLYKNRIEIYNYDAIELIKTINKSLPSNTLIYFDPPYYMKGKELYFNYYRRKNHEEISNKIKKINKHRWIVTYDNVASIRKLYKLYRKKKFLLNYSAGRSNRGEEVMIFSNNINVVGRRILDR